MISKKNILSGDILALEGREWDSYWSKIGRAADRAMHAVDAETVGLFRRGGLPLPPRLAKSTWGDAA